MREKPTLVPFGPQPNPRIIEFLREALKDAKAGRIQALGVAIACASDAPDADLGRATETVLTYTDGWAHSLACAVNGLAFRLNHERYTQGCTLPDPKLTDEDE
jgi:hypothetical protein